MGVRVCRPREGDVVFLVMAGLVPAIPLRMALTCLTKRGHRDEPGGDRMSYFLSTYVTCTYRDASTTRLRSLVGSAAGGPGV